jgi:small subunit ribosomal protein S15
MTVTKESKIKIVKDFWTKKWDTGSTKVQIAILTSEIENLKEHLLVHKKDNHSRRWILLKVAKRRKLLGYLKRIKPEEYNDILKTLNIRK